MYNKNSIYPSEISTIKSMFIIKLYDKYCYHHCGDKKNLQPSQYDFFYNFLQNCGDNLTAAMIEDNCRKLTIIKDVVAKKLARDFFLCFMLCVLACPPYLSSRWVTTHWRFTVLACQWERSDPITLFICRITLVASICVDWCEPVQQGKLSSWMFGTRETSSYTSGNQLNVWKSEKRFLIR